MRGSVFYSEIPVIKTSKLATKVVDRVEKVAVDKYDLGDNKIETVLEDKEIFKTVIEEFKEVSLGDKPFKGLALEGCCFCASPVDGLVPFAVSYDELAEKAPDLYEQVVWTDCSGIFLTMAEWRKAGKPPHSRWFPKHVFFGVDPGFSLEKAEEISKKEKPL
jgi:hypothetical protein